MRKVSSIILLGLALVSLYSCNKENNDPIVEQTCEEKENEIIDRGRTIVKVLNFSDSTTNVVSPGGVLTLSLKIIKEDFRARLLKLWQSDCYNTIGEEIDLSDQQGGEGTEISLRNTDEAQFRVVEYTVPTDMEMVYLTIEVQDTNGLAVFKQLELDVTGSNNINSYKDVIVGAQQNLYSSWLAPATGMTFYNCDAAENTSYIDVAYAAIDSFTTSGEYEPAFLSISKRKEQGIGNAIGAEYMCNEGEGNPQISGGGNTKFAATTIPDIAFDGLTDEASILSYTNGLSFDNEYVTELKEGYTYGFQKEDGRVGLIKVNEIVPGTNKVDSDIDGYIVVDIKTVR